MQMTALKISHHTNMRMSDSYLINLPTNYSGTYLAKYHLARLLLTLLTSCLKTGSKHTKIALQGGKFPVQNGKVYSVKNDMVSLFL